MQQSEIFRHTSVDGDTNSKPPAGRRKWRNGHVI